MVVNEDHDPLLSQLQEFEYNGMTDEDDVEQPSNTTFYSSNVDDGK